MKTTNIPGALLLLASLYLPVQLAAQDEDVEIVELGLHRVELGVRLMPTVSDFELEAYEGGRVAGEATFGYGVGGVLAINLNEHIGIQGELMYNSLSQRYTSRDIDRRLSVQYLSMPLLLSLNTNKTKYVNLNLVFGPQYGFTLGSDVDVSGDGNGTDTLTAVWDVKRGDFGFAYGAGLSFSLNDMRSIRLDLGYRGLYGIMNISDTRREPGENNYYPFGKVAVRTHSVYLGLVLCI